MQNSIITYWGYHPKTSESIKRKLIYKSQNDTFIFGIDTETKRKISIHKTRRINNIGNQLLLPF